MATIFTRVKQVVAMATGSWFLATGHLLAAAAQSDAQGGFVPADQLAKPEAIPAAPLLLAAYAFVWVAVVFYVFTIWRRVGRMEREIAEMRRQVGAGSPSSAGGR